VRAVARVDFADPVAAVAAFLTLVTMPFAFSISDGIAFGTIAYAVLMLASGRAREVHGLLYACAALFLLRYGWFR
jgi:AGZA family xanthine/uracil permease-like MFS transporter